MRRFREIKEAERPGGNTGSFTLSEEAMKKYDALFAEPPKQEDKEEALEALNRKIRGQELVAGTMAHRITKASEMFASTADERKKLIGGICHD